MQGREKGLLSHVSLRLEGVSRAEWPLSYRLKEVDKIRSFFKNAANQQEQKKKCKILKKVLR